MGELKVRVNEQTYTLTCDDGEEDRVRSLAKYLDDHVERFAHQVGRSAESRLLFLAALTVCDELFELKASLSGTTDPDWAKAADDAEAIASQLSPPKNQSNS